MLAERRKKRKWTLNPCRRNLWNRDDSVGLKFGKELMEKMGWSEGKGLGVNEQGIKQPLKVDFKNDTKGMGFKDDDDKWIQHQNYFNQLLNELTIANKAPEVVEAYKNKNNKIKKQEKTQSLEDKSQNSKARIHYHKFTRAKDVSTYSEKDLDCILGKSRENSLISESDKRNNKAFNNDEEFEMNTVNAGSMVDYFSKKMKSKNFSNINDSYEGKNSSRLKEEKVLKTCDLNSSENCKRESKNLLEAEISVHESSDIPRKKKKNKIKLIEDAENVISEELGSSNKVNVKEEKIKSCSGVNECIKINESEVIELSKKTKGGEKEIDEGKVPKKRKLAEKEHNENIEYRNSNKSKKKKHNEECIKDAENEEIIYKKKKRESGKKTNKNKDVLQTYETETLNMSELNIERDAVELNREINVSYDSDQQAAVKKKKSKNKKKDRDIEVALDEAKEENLDVTSENRDLRREKKKDHDEIFNDPSEVKPYKRKKKKIERMPERAEKNGMTYRKRGLKSFKIPLIYKIYKVKANQFVGSNLTSLTGYGKIKYLK